MAPSPKSPDGNWPAADLKDQDKLERQMAKRGWTHRQIGEAVERGEGFPAVNNRTGGEATRYVHPRTGRSVVIDNAANSVIMVGGDGFQFDPPDDDTRAPSR